MPVKIVWAWKTIVPDVSGKGIKYSCHASDGSFVALTV